MRRGLLCGEGVEIGCLCHQADQGQPSTAADGVVGSLHLVLCPFRSQHRQELLRNADTQNLLRPPNQTWGKGGNTGVLPQ